MKKIVLIFLLFVGFAQAQTDTLTLVSYNLLNYPDGRDDCGTNTVVPDREDTLREILGYTKPDIFVGCEIQNQAAESLILNHALNYSGAPNYAAANFTQDGSLNNMLFYNSDLLTIYSQHEIATYPREIDHYVLYFNDPNLGTYFDTTFVDVYMCHLKAGNSSSNEQIRENQVQELMDYIATQPSDHSVFVCGDLNVYSSNESGYQLLTSGPLGLNDPINAPGNWNNSGSYDYLHTQSTRTSMNFDCGSKGGLDDRFDQILVSSNVLSGNDSVRYLQNSYDAVGNDGNHFNTNLVQGSNSQYPQSLVSALYHMSDHLPVMLKAVVTYPTSNGLALNPSFTPVSCYGESDGTATVVPNDGQPPYSYVWDNSTGNQMTQTATGLSSGQYCVQITDDLGQTDSYCVYVPSPDPITFNAFKQPENNSCDGAIYILVEGGEAPYSFDWNGGSQSDSSSAEGLCNGVYVVTITDAQGCDTTVTIELGNASVADYEQNDSAVRIYPNPVLDNLQVKSTRSISDFVFYDQLGQVVNVSVTKLSEQHVELNLSNLSSGIYFLKVGEEQFKVVKE